MSDLPSLRVSRSQAKAALQSLPLPGARDEAYASLIVTAYATGDLLTKDEAMRYAYDHADYDALQRRYLSGPITGRFDLEELVAAALGVDESGGDDE